MIDHVLGRPSVKSRRLQVLAVILLWGGVLVRGHRHGPPGARFFSKLLSKKLTAWQTFLTTLIYVYAARNASTLFGFAAPEPLGGMYDPTYFRATWIMTALDAGFWTAMRIRSRWLRDIASVVFSIFYLFAAERADEKVRKVRSTLTVEHMRVSWNKGTTPYLGFLARVMRPRLTKWPPREIRIPRPASSDYRDPVSAWLYYDGPVSELREHSRVVLDVPGGGFVSMSPRCHDDRLLAWATKTGLPVLSLDYRKAPEYPYPYALNECFDVYTTIVNTHGKCLGLAGDQVPSIVVAGDSAGGNLAVAMTLMLIERNIDPSRRYREMPLPDGLMLCYPSLDMNIGNWMTDEQMSLIRDRRMRRTNKSIMRRKSMQYASLVGTPHHSDDEDDTPTKEMTQEQLETRLSMSLHARSNSAPANMSPSFPLSPQPEFSHAAPTQLSPTDARPPPAGMHEVQDASSSRTKSQPQKKQKDALQVPQIPAAHASTSHHPEPMRTRLATSSMISYFNDRVLTPEMMRAMIILYIGPHNRPDFSREYLLSPVLAPDSLLERFPKTYFLTGERDPLVDDTVIFAGRLRRVKEALFNRTNAQQPLRTPVPSDFILSGGSLSIRIPTSPGPDQDPEPMFDAKDVCEVTLIPGTSHGFLQVAGIYPPAWKLYDRCVGWMEEMFMHAEWTRQQPKLCRVCSSPTSQPASASGASPHIGIGSGRGHHYGESSTTTTTANNSDSSRTNHTTDGTDADDETDDSWHRRRHHQRMDSEGSDGSFLEMSAARGRGSGGGNTTRAGMRSGGRDAKHLDVAVRDFVFPVSQNPQQQQQAERGRAAGRRRSSARKDRSLVKLGSTDDLLGRRMQGLAAGLTRLDGEEP
jgi:acetyl esterase/lipase